jgi:hypothetical protein
MSCINVCIYFVLMYVYISKVQQQKRTIRLLKTKLCWKPDVRCLVRQELLKSHSRATVNFMMGKQGQPGLWNEKEIIRALLLRSISMRAYRYIQRQNISPYQASLH